MSRFHSIYVIMFCIIYIRAKGEEKYEDYRYNN